MSIIGGVNGFIEKDCEYLLLAFSNDEILTDAGYAAWRSGFADIFLVEGFSEGIRTAAERDQRAGQRPAWNYMAAFGFSGNIERLAEAIEARSFDGGDAIWLYKAIGKIVEKAYLPHDEDEHIFMALTNVKEGRQDDFDKWYNEHHVPDVVATSPYRSGRRFKALRSYGAEMPWDFLAFYRFTGPALDMHQLLPIEMARYNCEHSDAYKDDDGAWIWSPYEPCRERKYKVGVISGSLREDSYCKRLAEHIRALLPDDIEAVNIDASRLDAFCEDIENDPPEAWVAFRDAISAVDAYLFVTPEYNRSFPGALKNAIDVGSRPWGQSKWTGKPGAIAGASISALGGALAVSQLRQTLSFLNINLMNEPELYLTNAGNAFDDDGGIQDDDVRQYIFKWTGAFIAWIRRNVI